MRRKREEGRGERKDGSGGKLDEVEGDEDMRMKERRVGGEMKMTG